MKTTIQYLVACLAVFLCASVVMISCKEDEEGPTEVMLYSFGPSGIEHGETLKFIGLNLDKVTEIDLAGGVVIPSSSFTKKESRLIELTVPEEAEAGLVVLKTPDGDITTKTPLSFKVPVILSSITEEARPGAEITIKGTLVNWIEEIVFNDGVSVLAKDFNSKSTSELKVNVPLEAQTGFLIFKSGGTKPESFASAEELIVTLPAVTSISPLSIKHEDLLTITGTDLDLVTAVVFPGDKTVAAFESQSATEIVLAVPDGALKGKLTLKQASPVDVVTADDLTIILPVGTSITPKPAKPGIDNVIIVGTDLLLVKELKLPTSGVLEAEKFLTHTDTEISFLLPEGTRSGGITYTTIHGYSSNLGVNIVIPAPGPQPLPISLFDETIAPGGGDWSWETVVSDPANTEQFYSGDVSWKFETDNWGGVSSGGITPIDASSMDYFSFAIYGGPGTEGKKVAAILNDKWTDINYVILKEGEWTSYQIELSKFPSTVDLTQIVRFAFKVDDLTPSTIYIDRVGFEEAGPPPLLIELYDETIGNGGGDWSWETVVSDKASSEQAYSGSVSWKFETNNTGGLSAGGITPVDATGATNFTFALYGGPGTSGKTAVVLNDNWAGLVNVDVVEGQWTLYSIPITSFGTTDMSAIIRFAFKFDTGAASSTIYADRVGFD